MDAISEKVKFSIHSHINNFICGNTSRNIINNATVNLTRQTSGGDFIELFPAYYCRFIVQAKGLDHVLGTTCGVKGTVDTLCITFRSKCCSLLHRHVHELLLRRWAELEPFRRFFVIAVKSVKLLLHGLTPESPSDTINPTPTNTDGGPGSGNFGHEGRKGQVGGSGGSLGQKEKDKIVKRLVGQSTHDGVVIRSVSAHAFDRIGGRKLSVGRIDSMRTQGTISPGHQPDTRCYDVPGSRMVINTKTGNVITVMWRRGGKK